MPAIDLIVVGKMKHDPLMDVFEDYRKRMQWKVSVTELEGKNQADEISKIEEKLDSRAALIILDERGQNIGSRDFAARIDVFQTKGISTIQCVIGGADGLSDDIRKKAALMLSFGKLTWPHKLARVMLIEQIYRAQQILAGHPYHRD